MRRHATACPCRLRARCARRPRSRVGIGVVLAGLFAAGAPAQAQTNLDFETPRGATTATGGSVPGLHARGGNAEVSLDGDAARTGRYGLRIATQGAGRGGFSQLIDARGLDGDRLRVTAFVKTQPAAEAAASLRIRVDGRDGLLYIGRERARLGADSDQWSRIVVDAPIASRAERISFGGELEGEGEAWFDDFAVETLETSELAAPSAVATRYVEQALRVIDRHAVARDVLDWPAFRRAVMAQARGAASVGDAHLAVRYALSELGDGHSYFMSPRQMASLDERPVGNARTSRAPRAPHAELLEQDTGYLWLPGIAGGDHMDRVEFAEAMQRSIAGIDAGAACGWILDLRDNQGGNLWPMLAGVGPLLGDGDAGASLRRDGERRRIWYADGKAGLGDYVQLRVRGEPYRLERADARVAVIVNAETASAAEIIAAAFAGRARTRSFGVATRGATTGTQTFPLSDGAALMLAVASIVDPRGRIVRGRIEPDEIIAAERDDSSPAAQPVIAAARRWLESQAALDARGGCGVAAASAPSSS